MHRNVILLRDKSLELIDRHRLPSAVIVVILISLLLTGLNMWLYVQSGASGLDLSRPGFDAARDDIRTTANEPEFSAEGPLNAEIIEEYIEDYSSERTLSAQLGEFGPRPLSDEALGFGSNKAADTAE